MRPPAVWRQRREQMVRRNETRVSCCRAPGAARWRVAGAVLAFALAALPVAGQRPVERLSLLGAVGVLEGDGVGGLAAEAGVGVGVGGTSRVTLSALHGFGEGTSARLMWRTRLRRHGLTPVLGVGVGSELGPGSAVLLVAALGVETRWNVLRGAHAVTWPFVEARLLSGSPVPRELLLGLRVSPTLY